MPITFRFLDQHRLVISKHEGTTDDREFLDKYNEVYCDPRFEAGLNILVDLRQSESGNRSIEGLKLVSKLVANIAKKRITPGKIAIVAPSDVAFGLSRIFEAYSGAPNTILIARDIEEILEFLDLDADAIGEC